MAHIIDSFILIMLIINQMGHKQKGWESVIYVKNNV